MDGQFDQQTHPELQDGEIWYINTPDYRFKDIDRRTKRLGRVAYDINGNPLERYRPVFIQKTEAKELGN